MSNTINQMELTDILLFPWNSSTIHYSRVQGEFSRTGHIVCYKTSLNKFKKTIIISGVFCDQTSMKVEINNIRRIGKFTNVWTLNNTFFNNQWVKMKPKGK